MGWFRGSQLPTNGVVLNLDSNNTKSYIGSGVTWNDLSGNKNNGTLISGVTFSANSMFFNGINNQISIPDNPILRNSNGSISVWFKIITAVGGLGIAPVIQKSDVTGSFNGWQILAGPTSITIGLKNSGTNYQFGSIAATTTKWTNVTLTYSNSTTWRAYLNGVFFATQTTLPVTISSTNVLMGISNDSFWSKYNGFIQSAIMYNRTLTDAEVLQIYNAGKSKFGY